MAIAFDAATTTNTHASSITFSHTCTGTDRALTVGSSNPNSTSYTGATYNAVAMIQQCSTASLIGYSLTKDVSEPASGANNVVISMGASDDILGAAISLTGVASVRAANTTAIASGTDVSVTVTSVANDWVVDFCLTLSNPSSAGAGQTVRVSVDDWSFGILDYRGSTKTATTTSTTMSYVNGPPANQAIGAVSLVPAGGGGTTFVVNQSMIPIPGARRTRIIQL